MLHPKHKMAAASRSTFLIVLLSAIALVCSLKNGTTVSQCEYPGIIAVLTPGGVMLCNGFRVGTVIYVPEFCGAGIDEVLQYVDIYVIYGDGTKNITIPVNSTGGTVSNGLYVMNIIDPMTPDCNSDATLFDRTMSINDSSCEVVGYGGDEESAKIYDGVLKSIPLTRSTSVGCCKIVFNSLNGDQKNLILNEDVPLNCVSSPGAACGLGDLGDPVYCRNLEGKLVVVGLTASIPCENGGTFLIHDLTGGDPTFKFGIRS